MSHCLWGHRAQAKLMMQRLTMTYDDLPPGLHEHEFDYVHNNSTKAKRGDHDAQDLAVEAPSLYR